MTDAERAEFIEERGIQVMSGRQPARRPAQRVVNGTDDGLAF